MIVKALDPRSGRLNRFKLSCPRNKWAGQTCGDGYSDSTHYQVPWNVRSARIFPRSFASCSQPSTDARWMVRERGRSTVVYPDF